MLRTLSTELCLSEEDEDESDEEETPRGRPSSSSSSSSSKSSGKGNNNSSGNGRGLSSKQSGNKTSLKHNKSASSRAGSSGGGKKGTHKKSRGGDMFDDNPSSTSLVDESAVVDNEQSWIQCDDCSKWRRVPWYVDADSISEFICSSSKVWGQNFSCSDPEEVNKINKSQIDTHTRARVSCFSL